MNYVKTETAPVDNDWFAGKTRKLGRCFYCDERDYTYDVGAMAPQYRACKRCIKNRGLEMLKRGADSALALIDKLSNRTCRHCGDPVIQPERGFAPLMCSKCMEELRTLAV